MQAILLVAGKSSRFYPYNHDLEQKSFVVMMGKTLLEHTIDALKTSGITSVVIVIGTNSQVPVLLSHRKDIAITYVEQPESLGMGDALLHAQDHLEETFFVLGPYHMDIGDFAKDMLALQGNDKTVVLVKKDEVLDRYGNVTLQGDRVLDVVEKPQKTNQTNYRLAAIYLLNKKFIQVLKEIPTEQYHFEKALAILAKKGQVKALVTEKQTITLKYVWDLLGVKDYLLRTIVPYIAASASVAADAVIQGNVIIEDGATILEGACIKGPAYIGKHAVVGDKAILRNGVILEERGTIGSQMELKNTFVMHNTTTHAGFIGDSIIGHDTKIAGGVITANVRLDRQSISAYVKNEKVNTGIRHLGTIIGNYDNIGIRVAIMPGVIIGNHVVVGPSTTVMRNIEDNKKYYTKFQEIIEENTHEQ